MINLILLIIAVITLYILQDIKIRRLENEICFLKEENDRIIKVKDALLRRVLKNLSILKNETDSICKKLSYAGKKYNTLKNKYENYSTTPKLIKKSRGKGHRSGL